VRARFWLWVALRILRSIRTPRRLLRESEGEGGGVSVGHHVLLVNPHMKRVVIESNAGFPRGAGHGEVDDAVQHGKEVRGRQRDQGVAAVEAGEALGGF